MPASGKDLAHRGGEDVRGRMAQHVRARRGPSPSAPGRAPSRRSSRSSSRICPFSRAATAACARRGPMEAATARGVVPGATRFSDPSGSVRTSCSAMPLRARHRVVLTAGGGATCDRRPASPELRNVAGAHRGFHRRRSVARRQRLGLDDLGPPGRGRGSRPRPGARVFRGRARGPGQQHAASTPRSTAGSGGTGGRRRRGPTRTASGWRRGSSTRCGATPCSAAARSGCACSRAGSWS